MTMFECGLAASGDGGGLSLAPIIALIGSDGAGKSTVAHELFLWMNTMRPTHMCHLGKQSGNVSRRLARVPLFGARIDRGISAKTKQARSQRGISIGSALVLFLFLLRRLRRFRRMLRLNRAGYAILADRYPQCSVPGLLDGPAFGRVVTTNPITRTLAHWEARVFDKMTAHPPTVVLRLRVDLETAVKRKPDHKAEALAAKIEALSKVSYGSVPIFGIDATLPLDEVIAHAKSVLVPFVISP